MSETDSEGNMFGTRGLFRRRRVVSVLAALFGISSWIEITGLWVELPLMIPKLPEGAYIGSYLVIVTQGANLGPLLYSIARFKLKDKMPDVLLIHITIIIANSACVLLIFFWDGTTYIGGYKHSTALLTLAFFLATMDCTSSVLYMPFVGRLRQEHLLPFLFGEGLSGLVPGLVALIQGVGGNPTCVPSNSTNDSLSNSTGKMFPVYPSPRFSIEVFFVCLLAMLLISWAAFTAITLLPGELSHAISGRQLVCTDEVGASTLSTPPKEVDVVSSSTHLISRTHTVGTRELVIVLFLQSFTCVLSNSFLPALQSFSCQPYGNVAFHLAVTLSTLSNPLSCLFALRWWSATPAFLGSLTSVGVVTGTYLICLAAMSPNPPLVGNTGGEFLVVVSWTLFTGSFAYVRACLATHMRKKGTSQHLFYLGACSQIGSLLGAILSFGLVNIAELFTPYVPCT